MRKHLIITAGVLCLGLVVQSFVLTNVSTLNSNNFASGLSNDQGKKKGHDNKNDDHHDDDHHKNKHDHHSNNGHSDNGSLTIKVDLGKELRLETNQNDNHKGKGHGKGNKHAYDNHPSDFGQHRAYEARNKHKHFRPKKEKEAYEGIQLIITRNNFLLIETSNKITLARQRNEAKRESGGITLVMYNNNLRLIDSYEKRRATIELRMEL